MSFNSIINNSFEKFRKIIDSDLEQSGIISTSSINETTRNTSLALDLLLKNASSIEPFLNTIVEPTEFDLFKIQHIDNFQNTFSTISRRISILKTNLEDKFINYQNRMSLEEDALLQRKKNVLQKLAFLNHVANNYQKVFVEEFYNCDFINGANTTLLIDKNSKTATLNTVSTTNVKVDDIFITEISNGLSGSLNSETNGNLWFTVDQNENTIFEYNKLDSGPCILGLKYTFNETVINEITIKTKITNLTSSFKIKNILFDSITSGSKNIKEICDINRQNLVVDYFNYDKNIGFSLKFLPIKCSSFTIEFEQNEYQNVYIQQTTQVSYRKCFTIAISEISIYSNVYNTDGILESTIFDLGYGLNGCDYSLEVFPKDKAFYVSDMELFQGNDSEAIVLKEKQFNLLKNTNLSNFSYRLNLKKVQDITNVNQIDSNFESLIEMKNIQRFISDSENQITINDTFVKDAVFLCRPDILKRSSTSDKTILVNLNSNSSIIENGDYYNSVQINSDIFSLDGIKFYKGNSNTALSINDYSYDINTETLKIKIGNSNFIGVMPLKCSLESKQVMGVEKNDTCYIAINENFEPDKTKIKVINKSNELKTGSQSIQFNGANVTTNTIFDLGHKYIDRITNIQGSSSNYISFLNEIKLNTLLGKLSYSDNLIQLFSTNEERNINFDFTYYDGDEVVNEDFEFWFKDNKIKGIAIKTSDLYINTIEESLKDNTNNSTVFKLSNQSGILVNSLSFSKNMFNGEKFEFVEFENGKKEFNTEKQATDSIPDQEIDYDQPLIGFRINRNIQYNESKLITTFNQSKQSQFKQFDLIIKDTVCDGFIVETDEIMNDILMEINAEYSNETEPYNKHSQAIYSLESNTGMFVAKRDMLILRNASINYKYYISSEDTNKVSVDYEKGIIYTSKPISNPETILVTYRYCKIEIDYSIYESIAHTFINDNTIQYNNALGSNPIAPLNKNLKLYYGKIKNTYDIKDIFQYYSPIIYSVKLGFN